MRNVKENVKIVKEDVIIKQLKTELFQIMELLEKEDVEVRATLMSDNNGEYENEYTIINKMYSIPIKTIIVKNN